VLFGKLLAVRLVSDMRDKHGAAVADYSWANQVVGDVRIVVRRTGAQCDGEQSACKSDLYVCASGLRSLRHASHPTPLLDLVEVAPVGVEWVLGFFVGTGRCW
jgi:hypothetical protein